MKPNSFLFTFILRSGGSVGKVPPPDYLRTCTEVKKTDSGQPSSLSISSAGLFRGSGKTNRILGTVSACSGRAR